ncbi:hypothetical protein BGZ80_011410 [Entomortierella chlamydospora]|uniref:F-box domain-containing protein n=1 Tax=Entomortierella chlamydospora TaxID=101097 RepID=A0A9P6SZB0_9FUNG|nr:hypothetical protein BGZ80_011410 [Entomortierella chlamydospora]
MTLIDTSSFRPKGLSRKKPSPLNIPELLGIIFSFLTPHTVQVILYLVCRQWYAVAKSYLLTQKPVIWTGNPKQRDTYQQQLSHHLSVARALVIQRPSRNILFHYTGVPSEGSKPWFGLLSRLEKMVAENQIHVNNLSVIQSLKVETQLLPLLNITGSLLTTLTLRNMEHPDVPLDHILVLCPRLCTLDVKHRSTGYYQVSYRHGSGPEHERLALPSELPLRSLTLESIGVEKAAIMRLLSSCPDLEELQLISLIGPRRFTNTNIDVGPPGDELVLFFRDSFLRQVASRCPDLKRVHFSIFQEPSWLESGLTLFPKVTHWSFLWRDVNQQILRSLRSFEIMLTTLEIVGVAMYDSGFAPHLHRFMCENRQLMHLIAPDVGIDTLWFDLEGILDTSGSLHSKYNGRWHSSLVGKTIVPFHRKIWSCRSLRTLHLTFSFGGRGCNTAESARIMFGYIAKVCPQLQDLSINCNMIDLSLDGGFCLLSKIHDLRRVKISTDIRHLNGPWNVDWIIEYLSLSLRTSMKLWVSKYKCMPRKVIYGKHPFISNLDVHALPISAIQYIDFYRLGLVNWVRRNDNNFSTSPTEQDIGPLCDPEHMIGGLDMRNVGHKRDILEHFEDRLSKNWPCWTRMENFEIATDYYNHIYDVKAMRETVRKLRPDFAVK